MTAMANLLLVEDNADLAYGLRNNLEIDGHAVQTVESGEAALERVRHRAPDLIVLDLMLPNLDGYQVLRRLRAEGYEMPVLILTARTQETDKVLGFRLGADDYVTKPFGVLEVLARIGALRDQLLAGVKGIEEVFINGSLEHRVPHNLNVSFNFVEGESLIMAVKDIAVSSGSACTSASLEPSYVLRALGRSDELAHSSIRFTLGRFTTAEEIDYTVRHLESKVDKLRQMSPLWEMHKDGIDLNTVQWAAH